MTKLYELPNGRRFITDIDKSTKICNVTEPQLDIIIGDLNRYAEMCEHAIPISDNATNGDMIKAITGEDFSRGASIYNHDLMICEGEYYLAFNVDWWNAPYKKED
jgi:hypothetical protein